MALVLASVLAGCSSTGSSGRADARRGAAVAAADGRRGETSQDAAARDSADLDAAARDAVARNDAAGNAGSDAALHGEPDADEALPGVDLSIEANLEEIDERTRRRYDSALAAMRAGNSLQASLELEELIEEAPGFPGPWVNLALLYKRDGRLAEARRALEQAIAIAPGFPPANNELGLLLRERGEFTAAEAAYRRALETDPANRIAHLNLGILLDLYLQRADEALSHYNEYQATLGEPDETVARWIVDLERRINTAERVARD